MADRIILSDESINSYGFRVLTAGIDLSAFEKNPVMLYDHRSYSFLPIGTWGSHRVEGDQLTAEPIFDMEDEKAAQIAGKYDRKVLNAASIGIQILATSEDPDDMLPGQTGPTVTKCLLYEASIVPMPSNTNAVRLYNGKGDAIDLSDANALHLALNPNTELMKDHQSEEKKGLLDKLNAKADKILQKLSGKPADDQQQNQNDPEPQDDSPEVSQLKATLSNKDAEIAQLKKDHEAALDMLKADNAKELKTVKEEVIELKNEVKKLAGKPAEETPAPAPKEDSKTTEDNDPFADLNARAQAKFLHIKSDK